MSSATAQATSACRSQRRVLSASSRGQHLWIESHIEKLKPFVKQYP